MKLRDAFTMIELVFVILIMGIIGKFGVEFMTQAYQSYIFSTINYTLQSNSATAIEILSKRLQFRIKDSIIARKSSDNNFTALSSATGGDYDILEWVGSDIDGFRGDTNSTWSGVIDVNHANANSTTLVSPQTDTNATSEMIKVLSNDSVSSNISSIDNAAIYFIGSNSDITTDYGWTIPADLTTINAQQGAMHPIKKDTNSTYLKDDTPADFNGTEVFEYYKLAWTAYAVVLSADGNLTLHSNYQPWEGENYTQAVNKDLLMQNVNTFQFMANGSVVKIQICVFSDLLKDTKEDMGYSICKEKTIY